MKPPTMNSAYGYSGRAAAAARRRQGTGARLWAVIAQAGEALIDLLLAWQERARMRTHLGRLDDRMLRDIGISRAEAEEEAGKPFWRA